MMHLYSTLLCIAVHPKRFYNHGGGGGGSLLNHHQCAASTWMMSRLPQDNGTSALTTHQLQVERRESHRVNQVHALTTHQLQVERRERHRANQVYALTTHQLQVARRESHRAHRRAHRRKSKMAPRMAAVLRAPGKLCSFSYVLFVFLLFYVLDVVSVTVYDRDTLLNIGSSVAQRKPDFEFLNAGGVFTDTVSEPFVWVAKSRKRRRRKRGKRAGVLIRLRRRAF